LEEIQRELEGNKIEVKELKEKLERERDAS